MTDEREEDEQLKTRQSTEESDEQGDEVEPVTVAAPPTEAIILKSSD